jgi:hypothetical protein
MKRNGCSPTIRMAVLFVRTSLTNLNKTQVLQYPFHLAWLEDW